MAIQETFDFIIVGCGAGSVPAALAMKANGKRVLIEKQWYIGGTSAFSGGVIWVPNNDHLNPEGGNDSHERARTYLDGLDRIVALMKDLAQRFGPRYRTAPLLERLAASGKGWQI